MEKTKRREEVNIITSSQTLFLPIITLPITKPQPAPYYQCVGKKDIKQQNYQHPRLLSAMKTRFHKHQPINNV